MIKTSSKSPRLAFILVCISLIAIISAKKKDDKDSDSAIPTANSVSENADRARLLLLQGAVPGSVPRPVNILKYSCGDSFYLPKIRYGTIVPKSASNDQSCSLNFFGSRVEKCTAHIICRDIETKSASKSGKCSTEYFRIADGLGGVMSGCGKNLKFEKVLKPTAFGHDLYVKFKGMSKKGQCDIFCGEDQSSYDQLYEMDVKKLHVDQKLVRKTDSCVCGIRKKTSQDGRIVGGENAKPFEFPWLAGFILNAEYYYKKNGFTIAPRSPVCGGSLITDRHIMTAAHCFDGSTKPKSLQVLLHAHVMDILITEELDSEEMADLRNSVPGGNRPPATDEEEKSLRLEVEKIVNHPLYKNYDFDVAIIVLKQPVDFKKRKDIRPLCLYPETVTAADFTYTKDDVFEVAGWGVVKEGGAANARILQKMKVPVIDWDTCTRFIPFDLARRHVCAAYKKGKIDACQGDSGSPAFKKRPGGEANQFHQVGVVSSGIGCARAGSPGLYTDVFEVLEWIYHQTSDGTWCKLS